MAAPPAGAGRSYHLAIGNSRRPPDSQSHQFGPRGQLAEFKHGSALRLLTDRRKNQATRDGAGRVRP